MNYMKSSYVLKDHVSTRSQFPFSWSLILDALPIVAPVWSMVNIPDFLFSFSVMNLFIFTLVVLVFRLLNAWSISIVFKSTLRPLLSCVKQELRFISLCVFIDLLLDCEFLFCLITADFLLCGEYVVPH